MMQLGGLLLRLIGVVEFYIMSVMQLGGWLRRCGWMVVFGCIDMMWVIGLW